MCPEQIQPISTNLKDLMNLETTVKFKLHVPTVSQKNKYKITAVFASAGQCLGPCFSTALYHSKSCSWGKGTAGRSSPLILLSHSSWLSSSPQFGPAQPRDQ